MNKYILMSLRGSFIKFKNATGKLSIIDLIKAKKEVSGSSTTSNYDINEDGEVTGEDLAAIRKILLTQEN